MSLLGKLFYPLKLLIFAVFSLLIIILLSISLVPILGIRVFVQILAKIFRRDLNGIFKPTSALLAQEELFSKPEFNIIVCSCYDTGIPIDLVREKLLDRIFGPLIADPRNEFEYEHLRNSVTSFCSFWFWKKQKYFKIQDYVRTYDELLDSMESGQMALPVRKVYYEEDLKTIVSVLQTKAWRRDFSPWEIIVLENYSASSSAGDGSGGTTGLQTVLIYRFHHCIADGYSILNFIIRSNEYEAEIAAVPTVKRSNPCLNALQALVMPLKAFVDLTVHLANRQFDGNGWTPPPVSPESSSYTATWTPEIPVERIKRLKNKFGVSFLAVIQGITAGALRKMMLLTGRSVPKRITCFLPLPMPNHRLGLRIHTITAMLPLHTGEPDEVERVLKAHQTLKQEGSSLAPLLIFNILKSLSMAPNFVTKHVAVVGITIGLSPFPGAASPIYFTPDHRSTRTFFTVGLPSTCSAAGAVTSLSNCGNMTFTLTSRNSIVGSRKESERFKDFIEEEIQALEISQNIKEIV